MKYTILLQTGDPSKDGHNQSENIYFRSNKSKQEIEQAYKVCCEKTGLVFTENTPIIVDGLKLDWQHPEYNDRKVCVDYQSFNPSKLAESILKSFGINTDYGLQDMFFDFLKIELKDFEYEVFNIKADLLNITIGYGLFE